MDKNIFLNGLNEIYTFFNRKTPEYRVTENLYKRIDNLPDDFMQFAIDHFANRDSLPKNMGYYLKCELWPEYLDKNPDLKSTINYSSCPNCLPELPGWRRAWVSEITGWGEMVYKPVTIRCACCNYPNPKNEPVLTDEELIAKGYYLENPDKDKFSSMSGEWRKCIGLKPETSKEHREYSEQFVEPEYEEGIYPPF